MSTYRKEWPCCGSVTETESFEPPFCPICQQAEAAEAVRAAERERCAKIAESRPLHRGMDEWDSTAAAIRGA